MKYLSTYKCKCDHFNADHEVRSNVFGKFKTICWECAAILPNDKGVNLDSYHNFKFGNLEYLQKLYEEKHRIK